MLPLLDPAPLLEEESGIRSPATLKNGFDPSAFHRPRTGTALAADDHPIDPAKVYPAEIFQKRLDAEEACVRMRVPQMIDSRHAVLAILYAHAPPDVRRRGSELQPVAEQRFQAR